MAERHQGMVGCNKRSRFPQRDKTKLLNVLRGGLQVGNRIAGAVRRRQQPALDQRLEQPTFAKRREDLDSWTIPMRATKERYAQV